MRHTGLAAASVTTALLLGCVHSPPIPASYDPVGNQTYSSDQIANSGSATAWEFLRRNVRRYDYGEDRYGAPRSIKTRRGRSSIVTADSDTPLIIIDGARLVDFALLRDLSTDSIESIELFSGISGTALIGTNAAAGVIYIHTWQASSSRASASLP